MVFQSVWTEKSIYNVIANEMVLDIHNDRSRGSINVFTNNQLSLFDDIITKADGLFSLSPAESEPYNDGGVFNQVPIYLIPFQKFEERKSRRCSSFAKKMRERYEEERRHIQENYPENEIERRLSILYNKYAPWLCSTYPVCTGCKQIWTTPLGYFDPVRKEICICLDEIIAYYKTPDIIDAISATVILHELGHFIMSNPKHPDYETPFDYWAEESLANKIALEYMSAASVLMGKPNMFKIAKSMVQHQSDAYALGLYLFEHGASDWHALKVNKTRILDTFADSWVEAVCDPNSRDFVTIQKFYYSALARAGHDVVDKASGRVIASNVVMSRVPWFVVNDYCRKNIGISFSLLQSAFSSVQCTSIPNAGSNSMVQLETDVIAYYAGLTARGVKVRARFHDNDPIWIAGGDRILVSNQWYADGNFKDFVPVAQGLGYEIR